MRMTQFAGTETGTPIAPAPPMKSDAVPSAIQSQTSHPSAGRAQACTRPRPPTFNDIDPYAKPPVSVRDLYKHFQRAEGVGDKEREKARKKQRQRQRERESERLRLGGKQGDKLLTGLDGTDSADTTANESGHKSTSGWVDGREGGQAYVPQPGQVVDLDPKKGIPSDAETSKMLRKVDEIPGERLKTAFDEFLSSAAETGATDRQGGASDWISDPDHEPDGYPAPVPVWEHRNAPGLLLIPGLIPPKVQTKLLDRMLHTDLQNPVHQTNLHAHYYVEYPAGSGDAGGTSAPSFFATDPGPGSAAGPTMVWQPRDPGVHKPLEIEAVLEKKLRWVTFGGQYDWTRKVYPGVETGASPAVGVQRRAEAEEKKEKETDGSSGVSANGTPTSTAGSSGLSVPSVDRARIRDLTPPFPGPVGALVSALFADTVAEAAILNFYSPGDTLSLHRDVSEFCDRPLVSLSFGCECVFVVGLEAGGAGGGAGGGDDGDGVGGRAGAESIAIRLRSGDAVVMSGPARFAWHGVPVVVPDTCPGYLSDWPARPRNWESRREGTGLQAGENGADGEGGGGDGGDGDKDPYERWRGWMGRKRINLNVRQMWA